MTKINQECTITSSVSLWQPTTKLRWLVRTDGSRVLQQMWFNGTRGDTEWRDIEEESDG